MTSRKIQDLAAAGLFVVAAPVLHYALGESWPNSIAIAVIGSIPGLALRLFRRNNTAGERNDDRVEENPRRSGFAPPPG
jgi:hypothetical protein